MKKLCFIFLILISANLFAANQYVDPSFTGTSNGTITNPWKSLSAVNQSTLNTGDSLLLKRGQKFTSGQFSINRSNIVIGAYGTGANPLLWGNGNTVAYLLYVNARTNVTIRDVTISDTTISPTDRTIQSKIQRGIGLDNSFNCSIINVTIDRAGVAIYITGEYNTVRDCNIGNLRMVVNTNDNGDNDYGANPLVISASNNTITNNYFHDCWATSFDYGIDGGAIDIYADQSITNTVITYNTLVDCNGMIEIGGTGGYTVTNTTLAYNKAVNNGSILYVSNSGTFQTSVYNIFFHNNTIVESEQYRLVEPALFSFKSTPSVANSLVLKNNAFYLYGTIDVCRSQWSTPGTLVHQNNVYKLGSGSVLNFTIDGTELITTASLANIWESVSGAAPNWNYTPATGSPLINFGQSLGYTTDFLGKSIQGNPDAGIIERSAVVQTPFRALLKFVE